MHDISSIFPALVGLMRWLLCLDRDSARRVAGTVRAVVAAQGGRRYA